MKITDSKQIDALIERLFAQTVPMIHIDYDDYEEFKNNCQNLFAVTLEADNFEELQIKIAQWIDSNISGAKEIFITVVFPYEISVEEIYNYTFDIIGERTQVDLLWGAFEGESSTVSANIVVGF